jgi:hypothetical protein
LKDDKEFLKVILANEESKLENNVVADVIAVVLPSMEYKILKFY